MSLFPGFAAAEDATDDKFCSAEMQKSTPFSIQVKTASVSGGSPKYSVMGSNVSSDEADMVSLGPSSEDIPLADTYEGTYFPFKFIGIKYEAGGTSAGTYAIHFETKMLSVALS